jgi:uncharacterized repeat protein (TIGR01451 family)
MASSPAAGGGCTNKTSNDPNALVGPAGVGVEHYIQDNGNWSYTADFENDGSVAAQNVVVTEQMDTNLDWSTFQLGSFGFGPLKISIPAGFTEYQTVVHYQNVSGTALNVLFTANFNVQTGLLTVNFISLDPSSGEAPEGVFDGFLPPDDSTHIGEGFVQYTVQPKTGLAGGTLINQQASIVFDTNAPLATNVYTNKISSNIFTDSFNGASAPNLDANWQIPALPQKLHYTYRRHFGYGGFQQVQNTGAVSLGSFLFAAEQVTGASYLNPSLQADVNASNAAAVGLLARLQSDGDAYVGVLTNGGQAQIWLFHAATNSFTVLGSANAGTNAANLQFTISGSTLSLYVNGTLKVSVASDTSLPSPGGVGIFTLGSNGIVDNFAVAGY